MSKKWLCVAIGVVAASLMLVAGCGKSQAPTHPLYELYTEADFLAAKKSIHNALTYPLKSMNVQCDNLVVGVDTSTDLGLIGTLDLDVYCSPEQKIAIAQKGANQFFKMLPKFNKVRVSVYNYRTGGPQNGRVQELEDLRVRGFIYALDEGAWAFDNPR